MSEETIETTDRRTKLRRILKIASAGIGALVALIAVALFVLDTPMGHRFLVSQIEAQEFENGMSLELEELNGSIYSQLTIKGLEVHDTKGAFARVPEAHLDWRPFGLLWSHLDIRELSSEELSWDRMPEFSETPPSDDPILPDMDIDVGSLELSRILIGEDVASQSLIATLTAEVQIADGQAAITFNGGAIDKLSGSTTDTLSAIVAAIPDEEKLDLNLNVRSEAGGLVSALIGAEEEFALTLAGEGDWQNWKGNLSSATGANRVADIAIAARNGEFQIKGEASPAPLLSGFLARLFSETTQVNFNASFQDRRLALEGTMGSSIFDISSAGNVDLASNAFDELNIGMKLHQPKVLGSNIAARDLEAQFMLDGAFSELVAEYEIAASTFEIGSAGFNQLTANGVAESKEDHFLIPLDIAAVSVSGLDEETSRQLRGLSVVGDVMISGNRLLADELALKSAGLDARATILGDLARGEYTAKVNGNIAGYEVASVGRFEAQAATDVTIDSSGVYLSGRAFTRSRRLNSSGVEAILGGQALTSANIVYDRDGTFSFSNLQMAAPKFRVLSGFGSYDRNGQVSVDANALSNDYGPLDIGVVGTLARPKIRVFAKRPGLGLGVTDLVANIEGTDGRYAILADGLSPYGNVSGDLLVDTSSSPLTIDVRRGTLAGVVLAGLLEQQPGGALAGQLNASGNGIVGTATLSEVRDLQHVRISATARSARFPGSAALKIERALIDADILLGDTPDIEADVQLAGASLNQLELGRGRAKINYAGGSGNAEFFAEGRSGVEFEVGGSARLAPDQWLIRMSGTSGGAVFHSIGDIVVIPQTDGYRLNRSRFAVAGGTLTLAGTLSDSTSLSAELREVDLAILGPLYPSLGVDGEASGVARWQQASASAFPVASAQLTIKDFTRASSSAVSEPVNMSLVGQMDRDRTELRMSVERNGNSYGRLHAFLTPRSDLSQPWTERLGSASLAGGIRYNGPAGLLFSLAALPEQRMSGGLGVAADFAGSAQSPILKGVVRSENLSYFHDGFGTRLTKMRIRGGFAGEILTINELSAKAGEGSVTGQGTISLSSALGYPLQLDLVLSDAKLADSREIAARGSGEISISSSRTTPSLIRGTLALPETRYTISNSAAAAVPRLTGVRRRSNGARIASPGSLEPIEGLPEGWQLDIGLVADDKLYVSGMGLESEWRADLKVTGTPEAPQMSGTVSLIRGTLGFAGRSFEITEGKIEFDGASALDAKLSLRATSVIDGVTTIVNVSGTGNKPDIRFTSSPGLPQDEVMARILFGSSVGELSPVQALQLASSLNGLRNGGSGVNPLGVVQSAVGIDRLRIVSPDQNSGDTGVAFGQYISREVYVEIVTNARGQTASQIEISLTPAISVFSQVSALGGSNVNVKYRRDY